MEIENLKQNGDIADLQTLYYNLQNSVNGLIDLVYPVGSYYETSNSDFDPNESWGGTWNKTDSVGYVTVAATEGSMNDQVVILEVGSTTGEVTHTLTQAEMPAHIHGTDGVLAWVGTGGYGIGAGTSTTVDFKYIESTATGKQQAHNNVQPSIAVWRWHRTA